VNITNTPKEQEHYPQISPDGTKEFASRWIRGRAGKQFEGSTSWKSMAKKRRKLLDSAREPFWSPDGKVIGFLPQEFPKFNVIDY